MSKVFPKWSNALPLKIVVFVFVFVTTLLAGITYYVTPKYTRVGYEPTQPVYYEHSFHVGELGMDCRFCHDGVDQSDVANVPTAETCMKCHSMVATDSPLLEKVRESYASGLPIAWERVHELPDYTYFSHQAHVNRGVSCVDCHGRVDEMDVVHQVEPHSMGWCLDCHRNPEEALRPLDQVYNLDWVHPGGKSGQIEDGLKLIEQRNITPPQSCTGCHR
jgi:hypothetical protein